MATMDVYGTWVAHIVTALVLWHIVALFGSSPWLCESCEAGAGGRGSAHLWPGKRVSPPYLGRLERANVETHRKSRASSRAKAVKISPIAI